MSDKRELTELEREYEIDKIISKMIHDSPRRKPRKHDISERDYFGVKYHDPSKRSALLSQKFVKIAKGDLQASKILHANKSFPHSVYFLQQSVEKISKAQALLTRAVRVNRKSCKVRDIGKILSSDIGHNSELGLFFRIPFNVSRLYPYKRVFERAYMIARKELEAESSIKERRRLWEQTLNLSVNNEDVRNIMDGPNSSNYCGKNVIEVNYKEPPKEEYSAWKDRFDLHLFYAWQEALSLCKITRWHEKEPRYPPITKQETYWDPLEYTEEKGIVSLLPTLQEHAGHVIDNVVIGNELALKITNRSRD